MLVVEEVNKKFTNQDGFLDALEDRHTERPYLAQPPKSLIYDKNRDVFLGEFRVSDYRDLAQSYTIDKPVLPYALSQLFHYLSPQDLTELAKLCTKLDIMNTFTDVRDHNKAVDKRLSHYLKADKDRKVNNNEIRLLEILNDSWFHTREMNPRTEPILLHYVEDVCGSSIRCFSTERYTYIQDARVFDAVDRILNKKTDWEFKRGVIGTVQSRCEYQSPSPQRIKGDEHTHGARISHSEFKYRTFRFMRAVWRLVCSNGVWGTRYDTYTAKHSNLYSRSMQEQFDIFVKDMALAITNGIRGVEEYISKYAKLEDYEHELLPTWDDLRNYITFRDFPIKIRNHKKIEDLIRIAKKEGYNSDLYGIVNTMSYYNEHYVAGDSEKERINNKINKIIHDADRYKLWTPTQEELDSLENPEEEEEIDKTVLDWINE